MCLLFITYFRFTFDLRVITNKSRIGGSTEEKTSKRTLSFLLIFFGTKLTYVGPEEVNRLLSRESVSSFRYWELGVERDLSGPIEKF